MYIQRSGFEIEKCNDVHCYMNIRWHEYRYSYKPDGDPTNKGNIIFFPFKLEKTIALVEKTPYGDKDFSRETDTVIVWLDTDEMGKLYERTIDFINYVFGIRNSSVGSTSSMLEYKEGHVNEQTDQKEEK